MNWEDFRDWAKRAADWAANYHQNIRHLPVRAQVRPGDILKQLPQNPPENGEEMADIFSDFENIVLPGITHWQHPRHFAYFPANASPPSVLAEQLTAALGTNAMLWQTSPAATEMEIRMMEWLAQMIGLSTDWKGLIQDTASSATFAAVLSAREKALNWKGNESGLAGLPMLRFYATEHNHSSVAKAVWLAGIGRENLIDIPTDDDGAMLPSALAKAVFADRKAGMLPAGLIAVIGATGIGVSDKLSTLLPVARQERLFIHVDAAWAGSALICPEYRHLIDGVEEADSFVFNPHKWLMTNFDCSAHFVKDPSLLAKTFAARPEYLQTPGADNIVNFSEWAAPLGRRFRALKLWFVIRSYGVEGIRNMIRQHIQWAMAAAKMFGDRQDFELTTPPKLSLFTFRFHPPGLSADELEDINARLLAAVNDDGYLYLTQARHEGKYVIRFQVGQMASTADDIKTAAEKIFEIAQGLR